MSFQDDKIQPARQAHDYLIELGKLTVRFASVSRAPRYPNGNRESDVEHSFHLALSAAELATDYYPDLNIGLVTQFSLVHDLSESYIGDTWTFDIGEDERAIKELAEKQSTDKLIKELPPHTSQLLERYEKQIEPEARFVRFVDKLMPSIINSMAGNARTFIDDHGVTDVEMLKKVLETHAARNQKMFPEFSLLHDVNELLSITLVKSFFKD